MRVIAQLFVCMLTFGGFSISHNAIAAKSRICVSGLKNAVSPIDINALSAALDGKDWVDGVGGFGNCYGQTAYFAGLSPILIHDDFGVLLSTFVETAVKYGIEASRPLSYEDIQPGDIGIVAYDEDFHSNIHSFTILDRYQIFSKNGNYNFRIPYARESLDAVAELFMENYEGLDGVRGSEKVKNRCIKLGYPVIKFFRLVPLSELENKYSDKLSNSYFKYRQTIWDEAKTFVQRREQVVNPHGVLSQKFKRARSAVKRELTARTRNKVQKFFWIYLNHLADVIYNFYTENSDLRKLINFDQDWPN
jgi:hypothetical protein